MAVGYPLKTTYADGDVYSASDVNDTNGTINLMVGNTVGTNTQIAGKNKIINGDFRFWQRGTSFSVSTTNTYLADRFFISFDGSGATRTVSQQSFTPGAAPVTGYEGKYFLRYARTVAGTGATFDRIAQLIEDVQTFAGQTITVSFWLKVDSGTPNIVVRAQQSFGSGGSADVVTDSGNIAVSTSWTRYSTTLNIPSISGKTIGASSYLGIQIRLPINTVLTTDIWGVQVEAGSVATPFQTATGTIQGELAACQRYYAKSYNLDVNPGTITSVGSEVRLSVNKTDQFAIDNSFNFPVIMRAAPTVTIYSVSNGATGNVYDSTGAANRAANVGDISFRGGMIQLNAGVTTSANARHSFQWVAAIEL